jgi:hypothetical protein
MGESLAVSGCVVGGDLTADVEPLARLGLCRMMLMRDVLGAWGSFRAPACSGQLSRFA